jgi:hypothetical protein
MLRRPAAAGPRRALSKRARISRRRRSVSKVTQLARRPAGT